MNKTTIKFDVNRKGIAALLVCGEVKADVKRRAEAVAAAARAAYSDMPIVVDDMTGNRARYRVVGKHPKAKAVEAKHRLLGTALDAAK